MSEPVVTLVDARFGYSGRVAAQAEAEISEGEVVAVLGANGSGKSTLVKGMLGLAACYAGEVVWFGHRPAQQRDRRRVGYVPQRQLTASPIPVSLDEVVRSGRVGRHGLVHRYRADDRVAVADAIRTVGLAGRERTPVRELSGGQQRRALVARALAGEPEVLMLDEPFAGVDHESQQALADCFRSLADRGVTLIVVLHELGPLAGVVTRELHMADGRLAYDGPPERRPAELHAHGDTDPHGGHHDGPGHHDWRPRIGLLGP